MLSDVESETRIFIDANIFLYGILDHWKYGRVCKVFLEEVNNGKYSGVTSILVCNEVFHRVMVAEIVERYGIEPKSVVSYLKNNWNVIKELDKAWITVDVIKQMENLKIIGVDRNIFDTALRHSKKYGLLANDATHLATMEIYGITNDKDFERVEWINVWKP